MMFRILGLAVASVALLACQPGSDNAADDQPDAAAEATAAVVSPAERLAAVIAAIPGRSKEEAARDADRQPAEVLAFLGLEQGMTVLDVMASGGWYSEVLSAAVGPEGKVIVQNPPSMLKFRDGAADKALKARFADNRLGNVERIDADLVDMGVAPGSVDFVLTALNFHDIYHLVSPEAAAAALEYIATVLKPGGVLGIIDHAGSPDGDNKSLHRIDPQVVKDLIEQSSLVLEADSGILHHRNDDMTGMVFGPEIRGKTHRFIFRLRKPSA
jgi:predicted methyltransferase